MYKEYIGRVLVAKVHYYASYGTYSGDESGVRLDMSSCVGTVDRHRQQLQKYEEKYTTAAFLSVNINLNDNLTL